MIMTVLNNIEIKSLMNAQRLSRPRV